MGLQLLVIAGPDKGRAFPLTPDDWLLVGRSKATETRLADPHVSKVHCKVEWAGGLVTVTDHDSTGGTFVNGRRVTREPLRTGDVIGLGETQLLLQEDGAAAGEDEGQTLQFAPTALGAALGELTGKALSHYALGPLLARGTTGAVYRARDTRDNRDVAVKVLGPEFVRDDEAVQRFVRAMRTMLPLRHPNLVAVHGAGKTGPHCWCAMEYVEGESLAQLLGRAGPAAGLDWRQGLRFAAHVARALAYAHRNAILHRNLTPGNVLVRAGDQVAKLGDLMLAKALEGLLAEKITRPGDVVGDVHYLAPERAGGDGSVDARSDLFSLGALTYALLAGRPPFAGAGTVETLLLIRAAEPARPTEYQPAVPAAFEEVVLTLLRKRPEERYQTAAEALQALEGVASAHGVPL
jgi:serine/threonine protein kinase